MCQREKHNTGQALVLVIMVLSILFVLTSSLGILAGSARINVLREEGFTWAYYAADAGIERALAEIKSNAAWYNALNYISETYYRNDNYPFTQVYSPTTLSDNVTYEVGAKKTRCDLGTLLLLQSVGRNRDKEGNPQAQKTLLSEISVFATGDYFRGLSILPETPVTLGTEEKLTVDSILVLNGGINLGGSTTVNGDLFASGDISGDSPGTQKARYPYIPPFPRLEEEYYLNLATRVYYSDTVFDPPQGEVCEYSGTYFVDGDLHIAGNYRGNALFFSTGDIIIPEGSGGLIPVDQEGSPDPGAGALTLIARGNIDINDNTVYAALMARGNLNSRGNGVLHGPACVNGIAIEVTEQEPGPFKMIYDANMSPAAGAVPVTTKILQWRELYPVF